MGRVVSINLISRECEPTLGLIYGYGIDDVEYSKEKRLWRKDKTSKLLWICPIYSHWKLMLRRVFRDECYEDCFIDKNWLKFSLYRSWYIENCPDLLKEWVIDKDLLSEKLSRYTPDTCVFMDRDMNTRIISKRQKESELPVGVYYDAVRDNYQGYSTSGGKRKIKRFKTAREAHRFWQEGKMSSLSELISTGRVDNLDQKVKMGLYMLISHLTQAYTSDKVTCCLKGYSVRDYKRGEIC